MKLEQKETKRDIQNMQHQQNGINYKFSKKKNGKQQLIKKTKKSEEKIWK